VTALAHIGHWSTTLAVVVPVAAVVLWAGAVTFRDRRRARRETREP
jgi:hypothetical protein